MVNHWIKRIILFLTLMVVFYLIVAFVTLKIDFREWTQEGRITYMYFCGIISAIIATNPITIRYE